jgi:hypothetical protein
VLGLGAAWTMRIARRRHRQTSATVNA